MSTDEFIAQYEHKLNYITNKREELKAQAIKPDCSQARHLQNQFVALNESLQTQRDTDWAQHKVREWNSDMQCKSPTNGVVCMPSRVQSPMQSPKFAILDPSSTDTAAVCYSGRGPSYFVSAGSPSCRPNTVPNHQQIDPQQPQGLYVKPDHCASIMSNQQYIQQMHQIQNEEKIQLHQQQVEEERAKCQQLQCKLDSQMTEIQTQRCLIHELQQQCGTSQAENHQLREQIGTLEAERVDFNRSMKEAREVIEGKRTEIAHQKDQIERHNEVVHMGEQLLCKIKEQKRVIEDQTCRQNQLREVLRIVENHENEIMRSKNVFSG